MCGAPPGGLTGNPARSFVVRLRRVYNRATAEPTIYAMGVLSMPRRGFTLIELLVVIAMI